ncbi:MAG: TlpA family protein disulfide reductase [Nocardioides sp.]
MPRRTRSYQTAALLIAALVALAGCAQPANEPTSDRLVVSALRTPGVSVDTPELRAIKERAGIEPCPAGSRQPVRGGPPDLVLPCLGGGQEVNLAGLRGPMIVNVWSANCAPCRDEMPILQSFYATYGTQVRVLGIDLSDTFPEAALQLAADSGVTYPLVADFGGDILRSALMRAPALPTTAFVDRDGTVTAAVAVAITSERQLVDLVRQHLGLEL